MSNYVVCDGVLQDALQPRTDRLYAEITPRSHLLPAERPWLYRVGDLVRLSDGEVVQILDGFLHIRRCVNSCLLPTYAPAGDTVLIIASAYGTGSRL